MSKTAVVEKIDGSFACGLDPEGRLNLSSCLQCGRCSSGCTMRLETDLLPHQINRMAVMGMDKELLESRAIWLCASCHSCVSRCPMEVNTPELIDKLREMAKKAPAELNKIRIFNDTHLKTVKIFGRAYEMGLMAFYKLRAKDLFSDMDKFPTMLKKGKISLLPSFSSGRKAAAKIFERVRARRGR